MKSKPSPEWGCRVASRTQSHRHRSDLTHLRLGNCGGNRSSTWVYTFEFGRNKNRKCHSSPARHLECMTRHIRCEWRRQAVPPKVHWSAPINVSSPRQTYKSIAAAASSAVPGRARGINGKLFGSALPVVAGDFAPGIPRATFLPPISMAAPSSFAAVNLLRFA